MPRALRLRHYAWAVIALLAVPALLLAGFGALVAALPMPSLTSAQDVSQVVLADDGQILDAYLAGDGMWRLPTSAKDVPPFYLSMLLAYEDKRFFRHHGVDPLAVLRATYQLLRHGHVVSGASTLTMQVARLLKDQPPGLLGKFWQAALAVKLERKLDKQEILRLYLTLAPFGGNIEGVRMASLRYFGKEPRELQVAEAALLIALPQSPERRRPDLHPGEARAARDMVLDRMAAQGVLSSSAVALAKRSRMPTGRSEYPVLARHLADRLHRGSPHAVVIQTLIDRSLQQRVEAIGRAAVMRQPDPANIAVLVVRNADLAVRCYLGGAAYFDSERAGMVDLVEAMRSPGSALKPLIYGIAFEDLLVHPDTIVTDDAVNLNGYAPENFDRTYRGDLRIRDALIASVNTIPVLLLHSIEPERFVNRLLNAGIDVELPDELPAGLAVAIGGIGIDLEGITELYVGLANRGMVRPLRFLSASGLKQGRRLLTADAAWAVDDILADMPPPVGRSYMPAADGGRRLAYKTGTSYGYRDAWAIGFDTDYTVAVWVGRPDGISRLGTTAATTAVPIMFRIFDLLPRPLHDAAADPPLDSILARHDSLPPRLQRFPASTALSSEIAPGSPLSIDFPANGSIVSAQRTRGALAPLSVVAKGGRPPFYWFVDGRALPGADASPRVTLTPKGRGQITIEVMDADGQQASTSLWVE